MALPSRLENRAVFALPNELGFSADFAVQTFLVFGFGMLPMDMALLY
ncbi:hypothetical protein [Eoetvoesiella caeni]|nr:hypothetical protein [Eoetvoesiella caeni]MCI2811048.1 hypothetical protein [Eoetvoesiella caeni]NYT56948.1 hypothetical protein [Eoetvoesiella caeni]